MKFLYFIISLTLLSCTLIEPQLVSEKNNPEVPPDSVKTDSPENGTKRHLSSQDMVKYNPLLPFLEAELWQRLLKLEEDPSQRDLFISLADRITQAHPLIKSKERITLGGATLIKSSGILFVEASINYPEEEIVEVIISRSIERIHETLLITQVRPLHLETLMHFHGHQLGSKFKLFISIKDKEIPLEKFLLTDNVKTQKMSWIFNGGSFIQDKYGPDCTGDLVLSLNSQPAIDFHQ